MANSSLTQIQQVVSVKRLSIMCVLLLFLILFLWCEWPEPELQTLFRDYQNKSSVKLNQCPSCNDYLDSINNDLKSLFGTLCLLSLSNHSRCINLTPERLKIDGYIRLYSSWYS